MNDSSTDEFNNKKVHPKLKSSFLCNLFFCWGFPIFYKGWKKNLDEDDLYKPLKDHESHRLGDQLEELWKLEKLNNSKPALWRALWRMFKKEIIRHAFIIFFLECILKISQPLLLGKLMNYYVPNQTSVTFQQAYMYAGSIVLTSLLYVLINHSYSLDLQHLGMKMRIACCSLVYRKTLKLSKTALVKTTIGQMINLLSNDVNRLDDFFKSFHFLWVAPLECAVIMYLLNDVVGITGIMGFSIIIFFVPLQMIMGKLTSIYRLKTAEKTDERVRLISEIISGIQVIKLYTWERPFSALVKQVRRLEIKQISSAMYIKALHMSFSKFITRVSVFLCIIMYTFSGYRPNAEYIYVISSFYNILKQAMTTEFPQAIAQLAECLVALDRIEEFMLFEEVHPRQIKFSGSKKEIGASAVCCNASSIRSVGIYLKGVSAKWFAHQQETTLNNITFNVGSKQLVAIVGAVGSGKTSLLYTIMKELPLSKGTKNVVGKVSYASQEPWLFAGTIRQNILFGEKWNSKKYEKVIQVCALERDFSILPFGDKCIVGDRGFSLSGGQKARVNLARAIYKEADIYLLDDPLSAVDIHVAKQLFDECICGYLKDKCTILVTHQLQFLRSVCQIYLMQNGKIITSGSYEEIRNSKTDFAKLFKHQVEDTESDECVVEECEEKEDSEEDLEEPSEIREFKSTGKISKKIYKSYIVAGGGWFRSILLFLFFVLAQAASSGADWFLKYWVNGEQSKYERELNNKTFFTAYYDDVVLEEEFSKIIVNKVDNYEESNLERFFTTTNCIYVYTGIVLLVIFLTIIRSISFYKMCTVASKRLHDKMFTKTINATMQFFNNNSSGRIINRFSKDMGSIDETLPHVLIDSIQIALNVLAVNIVIATVNLWFLMPTFVILLLFYLYRIMYLASSRNIKRMEATTRSPVFSHINASLQGLTTIRAFGAQEILRKEFDKHQDLHSSAYYMFLGCNRTFGFWLDFHCIFYIAIVTLSFFFAGKEKLGGNVGLAITQAMSLTGTFQWGMRQWSELENSMTSIERVVEYSESKQESDEEKKDPPKSWPEHGMLEFQSVYLRYATNKPYVLNNLTFKIKPRQKVGIVGRTGAGKSSLISALFRLADIEGKILIDGISTSDIPLKTMRSKIAIIPQEPVLFSGTLRSNLDPFNKYQDADLWNALEEVELKSVISDMHFGLDSRMSEGGTFFSMGQRQLICLARAIVRNNKILVLDEATANVDPKTDELIQSTIRRKFADCTVLTVAHRLHTVMDSDKVIVMDEGSAMEFNHPHLLLKNPEGIFYGLVKQTGKAMAEHLVQIAEHSYKSYANK